MKIFQKEKIYKIKSKNLNEKIKVYTARILEEDVNFIKFKDKEDQIIILNKSCIMESEEK